MDGMRTGLRHRLQRALRRVEEQHRHLRAIQDEIDRAVSGEASEISDWVARLRDALRAHFDLEEQVVFPALHGLVPALRQELERLEREHGNFLGMLDDLVDGRELRAAVLRALREQLALHERQEERVMKQGLAGPEAPDDQAPDP